MKISSASTVIAILAASIGSIDGVLADDAHRRGEHGLTRGGADPHLRRTSDGGRQLRESENDDGAAGPDGGGASEQDIPDEASSRRLGRVIALRELPRRRPFEPDLIDAARNTRRLQEIVIEASQAVKIEGMSNYRVRIEELGRIFRREIPPREEGQLRRIADILGLIRLRFEDELGKSFDVQAEIDERPISSAELRELGYPPNMADGVKYSELIITPSSDGPKFPEDVKALKMLAVVRDLDHPLPCGDAPRGVKYMDFLGEPRQLQRLSEQQLVDVEPGTLDQVTIAPPKPASRVRPLRERPTPRLPLPLSPQDKHKLVDCVILPFPAPAPISRTPWFVQLPNTGGRVLMKQNQLGGIHNAEGAVVLNFSSTSGVSHNVPAEITVHAITLAELHKMGYTNVTSDNKTVRLLLSPADVDGDDFPGDMKAFEMIGRLKDNLEPGRSLTCGNKPLGGQWVEILEPAQRY